MHRRAGSPSCADQRSSEPKVFRFERLAACCALAALLSPRQGFQPNRWRESLACITANRQSRHMGGFQRCPWVLSTLNRHQKTHLTSFASFIMPSGAAFSSDRRKRVQRIVMFFHSEQNKLFRIRLHDYFSNSYALFLNLWAVCLTLAFELFGSLNFECTSLTICFRLWLSSYTFYRSLLIEIGLSKVGSFS